MEAKSFSEQEGKASPPARCPKPNSSSTPRSSSTNAGRRRHAVGTTNRVRRSPTYTAKWPRGTFTPATGAGDDEDGRLLLLMLLFFLPVSSWYSFTAGAMVSYISINSLECSVDESTRLS